ncbi:hypothetical protein ABR763_19860 [Bacillus cereus]
MDSSFYDNPDTWYAKHKRTSQNDFEEYEYDIKQKYHLFNLDSLYKRMPKKSFIKGRKQKFEILMMYCWFHDIENDEENYWQQYLTKALT